MIPAEQFAARVAALERRGFAPPLAARLAGQLGDAIETDEAGLWVIRDRDTGEELARIAPLDKDGPGLDQSRRASLAETEAALFAYGAAFLGNDADWLHPSLLGTAQLVELIQEHLARGTPITVAIVEDRLGPLDWEW